MWPALAAATLIEQDNPVVFQVKKPTRRGIGRRTRSTMKKDDRLAIPVTAFLEIYFVDIGNPQEIAVVWHDWRIQPATVGVLIHVRGWPGRLPNNCP